ncbi:MAG: hypothetical protein VX641_04135 [Planctomycetota bacterium]|nr:hypothetical protein [Planctomycetota bacterium]
MLLSQLLWSGCAGTPPTPPATPAASNPGLVDGLPRSDRSRSGVELIAWRVADTARINEAIEAVARSGLEDDADALYRTSDIRVMRFEETALPSLLETTTLIGGSRNTWCGQILEWRNIVEVRSGRTLLDVLGEVMLVENGTLSISARIWVEHSLQGADTRVEFVPRYESDIRSPRSVLRSSRRRDHSFTELAVETVVPANEVLVITARLSDFTESPRPESSPPEGSGSEIEEVRSLEEEIARSGPEAPDNGLPDAPDSLPAPLSLGEAFFIRPSGIPDAPPERLIMIVVPRIPEGMLPQKKEPADLDST